LPAVDDTLPALLVLAPPGLFWPGGASVELPHPTSESAAKPASLAKWEWEAEGRFFAQTNRSSLNRI
jgi:hypothetical protein